MNMSINQKAKKYKAILDETNVFLTKLPNLKNPEKDYSRKIQQDVQSLLEIINYGILDVQLYNQVNQIYSKIVSLKQIKTTAPPFLNELYDNFRYIMEGILLIIENEFLIK